MSSTFSQNAQSNLFSLYNNLLPLSDSYQIYFYTLAKTNSILTFISSIAIIDSNPLTLDEAQAIWLGSMVRSLNNKVFFSEKYSHLVTVLTTK